MESRGLTVLRRRIASARLHPLVPALREFLPELAVALGISGLAVWIFLNAWVSEDAYITFRVIDNFMNGYGLRWNVHERVQVYTHPLWLLMHIPLLALWGNLFEVSVMLSLACTLGALLLTLYTRRRGPAVAIAFLLLPLFVSKSFMDYSTSGLENSLSYLLYALFGFVVMRLRQHRYFWFWCSLSVSLALFNRLDTALIYAPALIYLAWTGRRDFSLNQVLIGGLPLFAWFYFSLFYYGFLFPNTKYAKLHTEMSTMLYLKQGWRYAMHLLVLDTAGALILLSSFFFILRSRGLPAALALGIYAYCLYVIWIGGDYMAGRFWAFPIFASVWLWFCFAPERIRLDVAFAVACALLAAWQTPPLLHDIRKSCSQCIPLKGRVMNAAHTFSANRLVKKRWPLELRRQGHYAFGKRGRELAAKDPPPVSSMWYIGMIGYYGGPRAIIIDQLALADPLLARLPAAKRQSFYIGHFRRDVPKGYQHALETGQLDEMHPALAQYYSKLSLITSGNLLDTERLKTILYFNLGYYDHWKEEYLKPR